MVDTPILLSVLVIAPLIYRFVSRRKQENERQKKLLHVKKGLDHEVSILKAKVASINKALNSLEQKKVFLKDEIKDLKKKLELDRLHLIKELDDKIAAKKPLLESALEREISKMKSEAEADVRSKKEASLAKIEAWTSKESERLSQKLADEYKSQLEIIHSERLY